MRAPIRERERVVGEFNQIRTAAHGIQLAAGVERICDRDLVDGDVAHVQIEHGGEDDAMRRAEEIVGAELGGDLLDRLLIQHARCENGFLRFDVLGE